MLGAASTPSAETCNEVGSALAGRPVTLHKNEGNIESQKSPLVANNTKNEERKLEGNIGSQKSPLVVNNTKDEECKLGTIIHTKHCPLKYFGFIPSIFDIQ